MVIRRIEPLSCGKVAGVIYGGVGLVFGVIVSLAALSGGFAARDMLGPLTGGIIGVGAIVLVPLFYGAIAFIAGVVGAWLYNLAAGYVGGIEVDLK
jgi:hypothetical protein